MTDATADPVGAPAPKLDPEDLTLRARPRPVTRLNRRVLAGLVAIAGLGLFAAALIALDPPTFRNVETGRELFNTERVQTAEGLEGLPRDYGELEPPQLGPPLPGDLGPGMVEVERQMGITEPLPPSLPNAGFRPDPEEEAARQERLMLARELEEARTSRLFFAIDAEAPRNVLAEAAASVLPSPVAPEVVPAAVGDNGESPLPDGAAQNMQDRKLDFLEDGPDPDIYNPHALQDPASPYQVMAGTIIAASLVTGLNSDLPGQVIAQVTEHVYDTVTGVHLLIPQGTRLIGRYDSNIAFGQERALVVWQRLILPNGTSIVVDNLPGVDVAGQAGLEDEVDFHTWRLVRGIALSTLLGIGSELATQDDEDALIAAGRESAFESANDLGQEITRRNLDIQPTIRVRPGFPLRVIVNRDLILRPYTE